MAEGRAVNPHQKTILQEVAELERTLGHRTNREGLEAVARLLAARLDELAGRLEAVEQRVQDIEDIQDGGTLP